MKNKKQGKRIRNFNRNRIVVTGTAEKSFPPDIIRVYLTIEIKDPDYSFTMEKAAAAFSDLINSLKEADFTKEDIKTRNLSVETEYRYDQKEQTNIFVGYTCRHELVLEFLKDTERLSLVLLKAAESESKPRFDIEYARKDTRSIKNELIKSAVTDSKHKAEILAQACGKFVGDVFEINYSWSDVNVYRRPVSYGRETDIKFSSFSMDIEPEELSFSETVTVVWELKQI